MSKQTVSIVLLSIAGILIVLDIALALDSVPGNTISNVIWNVSAMSPILPFLAGVLAGHLFWRK